MAKLNAEKTNELLKAYVFGHSIESIAEHIGVDTSEVESIIKESTTEISAMKKYYNSSKLGTVKE